MDKYEDLIHDLRMCPARTLSVDPDNCDGCTHNMNRCWVGLMADSADAIQELMGFLFPDPTKEAEHD